jgi:exosortase
MSVQVTREPRELAAPSDYLTVGSWVQAHWLLLAITGVLATMVYWANFVKLFSDWKADENYSHGFVVPIVFVWMLWGRRRQIANAPYAPEPWGLAIVVLSLVQLAAGTWGAENFVANSSLVVFLCGVTLFLFGRALFRLVAFPIVWLMFMIPLPSILFYAITFPLQLLASKLAVVMLDLAHVPSVCDGNVLYLANFKADVAEACSGIRSLISVLAFAALLGHVMKMSLSSRWLLLAAAIPTALGMNALRIAGAGLIANYFGAQSAQGFFHEFSGWILFLASLWFTFMVAQFLSHFGQHRTAEEVA